MILFFGALCSFLAARAFEITLKEGDKAKFYDNLGTPIPESLFSSVIKSFHNGSSFFVHVEFQMDRDQQPSIVTARVSIKQFWLRMLEDLIRIILPSVTP